MIEQNASSLAHRIPSLSLSGRRAIVSAAASGIGRVIAETLVEAGARVEVCDVDQQKLAEMRQHNPAIGATCSDLADAADTERFFAGAVERLGGIDILINNAGIAGPIEPAESVTLDAWHRTLAINLTSHFVLARLAAPLMRQAGGGAIVNISSTAGLVGGALRSPYIASKWAVIGLTKSLAKELGPSQIRVNVICPGFVEGDRMERVIAGEADQAAVDSEEIRARYMACSSMRTAALPDDIAATVLFLVSDAGKRMSGHIFVVDPDSM